jgi:glycosyltransferase involved in cell wall biosynthesis
MGLLRCFDVSAAFGAVGNAYRSVMKKPSYSIVIPTHQRRDVVSDAVRALGKVEYECAFEIIVVVDGSTDGTAAALAQLQCPIPLRVIEQDNRGAAHARNRGAAESKSEILLFLDDDMIAEPDLLKQHSRSYADGADAVLGDFPVEARSRAGFLSEAIAGRKAWERNGTLTHYDVFTGHLSVRRSVFEALRGFDECFTADGKYGNEDIDFGLKLVNNYDVRHNPKAVCRQRSLVGPREYMRRARSTANADLAFAAKHPQLGRELFERRGASLISDRLRLLSRVPIVPQILAEFATCAAEIGLRTPFRSNPKLARLFHSAYFLAYWSAVQRNGGTSSL